MARNRKIGVIGANSMVGSRFCELSSLELIKADLNGKISVDITDGQSVANFFENHDFETVILFSAFTDVDAAEKQRDQKDGLCWQINVVGARNITQACRKFKRKLVFISTDFIFDGTSGPYGEEDEAGPDLSKVSWYGITKIEGEKEINKGLSDFIPSEKTLAFMPGMRVNPRSEEERTTAFRPWESIIIRISYPYRARFEKKEDFAKQILKRYFRGNLYPLFSDQQITPTFVDDIEKCIDLLLSKKASGTYHLASPIPVSPYEFGCKLIKMFGGDPSTVKKGQLNQMLEKSNATPRPLKGGMKTTKIETLGLTPTNWQQGISEVFKQSRGQLI